MVLKHLYFFNPHNNTMKSVVLLSLFYKWTNWGTERSGNLPQAAQLESGTARIWRQAVEFQDPPPAGSGINLLSRLPDVQIKGFLFIRLSEKYSHE